MKKATINCKIKLSFNNKFEAKRYGQLINLERGLEVIRKYYYCNNCKKWHLTSEGKTGNIGILDINVINEKIDTLKFRMNINLMEKIK